MLSRLYSHGQELFYKFISNFTNKLVKQLLSMTVVEQIVLVYVLILVLFSRNKL